MKKIIAITALTAGVIAFGGTAQAADPIGPIGDVGGEGACNWGQLTADAIAGGFPQGPHSSDPSGDGHGRGTSDEPRDGLANVVNKGDLRATCELISSLLP